MRRSVAMLTGGEGSPAEVLSLDILSRRGGDDPPQDAEPEARRRHRRQHDRVRYRPRGHRQDHLAMAKAVKALQTKEVTRIILTRPAVEAGERLGFCRAR